MDRALGLLIAIVGVAAGCSSQSVKRCTLDAQCRAPLVCSAPVPTLGSAPVEGTCRRPAEQGGLCYRDADCVTGLACDFPEGPGPFAEGDCEPIGFDASASSDGGGDGGLQ